MMSYSSQTSEQLLKYRPPEAEGIINIDEQTTNSRGKTMLSPENSYIRNPKDGPITKPTRRRSRESKKTPMVLLNASATNFRALVQQYTGCHSSPASYKGPINLNFAGANQDPTNHDPSIGNRFGYSTTDHDHVFSHTADHDHHHRDQQLQFENTQQPLLEDNHDQESSFFHGGSIINATNANPATYVTSDHFNYGFVNDHLPGDDAVYF